MILDCRVFFINHEEIWTLLSQTKPGRFLWLISISLFYSMIISVHADDYPAPKAPKDTSYYGKYFPHSMTLMATSTPKRRNTVRILFYGQSINIGI
jgi:hypothetical protein